MGFHAVSFGQTTDHGSISHYLALLFKDITFKSNDGKLKVKIYPYDDILIDGKHQSMMEMEGTMRNSEPDADDLDALDDLDLDSSDQRRKPFLVADNWNIYLEKSPELYEQLNDLSYSIKYKDTTYHIGEGHCCNWGIVLATVGDDCGGGQDEHYSIDELTRFLELIQALYTANRIESKLITMSGNCCS